VVRSSAAALVVALAIAAAPAAALDFEHQRLALAGAPATLFTADLDRDGRNDLVMVLAATDWGQIGVDEPQQVDETGVYVQVLTVVPMLFDRRTLTVHLGQPDGSFAEAPWTLELPDSVHALLAGPPAVPLLAWTDDGIAEVAIVGGQLALVPRLDAPSPLAGSRSFLPDLPLTIDLDGDGRRDLLLPTANGLEVHLVTDDGLAATASSVVDYELGERLPGDPRHYRHGARRQLPLPTARDLDGDGLPELLFRDSERGWNQIRVLRNLGAGRFGPPIDPLAGRARDAKVEVAWIGDLDGDGQGEVVTDEEIESDNDSMRAELAEARRPHHRYAVHPLGADLVWNPEAGRSFDLEGYVFGGGEEALGIPEGIGDLDGDGRVDFVALTLDFSLVQALRVMTLRSLRLGLDFQPYCQRPDGTWTSVAGQDLGGKFTLHLDRLRVGQLSSFAGDFDGDGRSDFVQLGRGRKLELRYGADGCRFPAAGAATLELDDEPADLALVRVIDLDGDRRSDLAVTTPPRKGTIGGRGTLDLYLARGGR